MVIWYLWSLCVNYCIINYWFEENVSFLPILINILLFSLYFWQIQNFFFFLRKLFYKQLFSFFFTENLTFNPVKNSDYQKTRVNLLFSMIGAGRYLIPDWLQKTGIDPRIMTNESVWPSHTSISCSVSTKFATWPFSSTPRLFNRVPYNISFNKKLLEIINILSFGINMQILSKLIFLLKIILAYRMSYRLQPIQNRKISIKKI